MKKLIILFLTFVFALPAWSACFINNEESVCSLSNNNFSDEQLLQNKSTIDMNSDIKSPNANTLNQSNFNDSFNQTQNNNGIQMQGSLGCQFGNCNREKNSDFLQNK